MIWRLLFDTDEPMNSLTDTHPDADAVQIQLLRQASVAQRLNMMRSLTRVAVAGSRRACKKTHPEMTSEELDVLFVELNYGRDLAARVRQRLAS